MSMFGNLMAKVFGPKHTDAAPTTVASADTATVSAGAAAPAPQSGSAEPVDVTAILDDMAAKAAEKLDWRKSIVDLMKLVGMDSSLSARKELADELHYTGSKDDSAAMNIWLHKQVMTKFAENGGKIPPGLQH
ncbi:MAG: DUF3597 domain-containing protein [Beijerinckiaceae bacterium]|nr:DUF3597 domain-containing protein [Beijerinckiaceae bacterium]